MGSNFLFYGHGVSLLIFAALDCWIITIIFFLNAVLYSVLSFSCLVYCHLETCFLGLVIPYIRVCNILGLFSFAFLCLLDSSVNFGFCNILLVS